MQSMKTWNRGRKEENMKKKRKPWFRKFIVNALIWLASKILEPIPVLGTLAQVVAFAL
jgi:hypothetical protein